jgi:hypothetical protein
MGYLILDPGAIWIIAVFAGAFLITILAVWGVI